MQLGWWREEICSGLVSLNEGAAKDPVARSRASGYEPSAPVFPDPAGAVSVDRADAATLRSEAFDPRRQALATREEADHVMTDKTQPMPEDEGQLTGKNTSATEPRSSFRALMEPFGRASSGWTGLFYGSLVHLLVLAVLGVGLFYAWAWLAPRMVETYRTAQRGIALGSSDNSAPGRSGLIYVESPEVYTRQRLVNDRYLQDAWLNERLAEIDNDEAGWIDRAYVSELLAVARLGVGTNDGGARRDDTPEPVTLPPELAEQLGEVPFQTRFRLQSQARDNIRQLILENALDDRHDLSGNTIFGLKFDTSVLPADNTYLNPTVAIRMCPSPLDELLRRGPVEEMAHCFGATAAVTPGDQGPHRIEDFVAHFLRFSGPGYVSFEDDRRTRDILNGFDDTYNAWRENVGQRLESFRRDSGPIDCGELPPPEETARLCTSDDPSTLSEAARDEVRQRLGNATTLDNALQHVMRLSDVEATIGETILGAVEANAYAICGEFSDRLDEFGLDEPSRAGLTVRDFLQNEEWHQTRPEEFPIPGAWGAYFRAFVEFLFPGTAIREEDDACPMNFDLQLEEPADVVFNIVQKRDESDEAAAELYQAVVEGMSGFEPLDCSSCDFEVFVHAPNGMSSLPRSIRDGSFPVKIGEVMGFTRPPSETLPEAAVERIEAAAEAAQDWRICRTGGEAERWPVDLLYLDPDGEVEQLWRDFGFDPDTGTCIFGRQVFLRIGAYEFFRRMTEVESYTYAAFPRGDVSGVVRQVHAQTGLELTSTLPGTGGRFGLTSGTTERAVEEQPIVVNFASGQNRFRGTPQSENAEIFDFGWSIVRRGAKEPMMASQLVLLSVPAYLDEITLEYWTGFLDPNRMPADRDAPFDGDRTYNDLLFEERVAVLMDGEEPKTMTLRVPPDYAALDSIVIGRNEIFGPMIRDGQSCIARTVDGNLSAIIPGDRLWRSTVVTLGTERADRIEVMPDMRGIRATFQFRCAEDAPNCDNDQRSRAAADLLGDIGIPGLELRVWTSEGSDTDEPRRCR
jgi:hypothetical protein